MNSDQLTLKVPSKIALAALAVLLIMAGTFFKERLFADTSYIAFTIINSKQFAIQEHRYGSFITQLVPYIGTHMHLPIKTILIAYTLSFNVFYCIVAYILYRFRQYLLVILMALFYSLFVTTSFFWPVNEINQAIAWMFLFFGVTLTLGEKKSNFFMLLIPFSILAFFTLFTHFVAIIPTTFLWVYFWLEKDRWPFSKKESIILSIVLICLIAVKYLFVGTKSYDDAALHRVTHFSLQDIIDGFSTPVIYLFLQRCVTLYWPAIAVLALGLVSLAKHKRWNLFIWTIVSLVGYFIIMGLSFGDRDEGMLLFHIESEWECIGIIVATPFVSSFLPSIKRTHAVWMLVLIFLVRVAYIAIAAKHMVHREQSKNKVIAQMKKKGLKRLALYEDAGARSEYMLTWGIPYESILISAMNNDDPQLTYCYIYAGDSVTMNTLKTQNGFWSSFYMAELKNINREYFKIDTGKNYEIVEEKDLFR